MKKSILFLGACMFTLTLFSFAYNVSDDKYPDTLPAEYVETLKKDFIKNMDGEALISDLQENFHPLFDEVSSVNAQFNQASGHYYLVFGVKDGQKKIEMLKIEESDMENSTYSYINFDNIEVNSATQYCTSSPNTRPTNPFVCTGGCQNRTVPCLGVICGIVSGTRCIQN